LTLRQLFYFVIVAEELNFHRAAARLHVSQPPLTQRIQAMERDLGVQLFTRTGKQIELTEAGRVVLAEAKSTLAQANRVWEMARRAGQGEVGTLRVSVGTSAYLLRAFREAVEAFRRDYPGVVLDLVQTTCRRAFEDLEQRRIDTCALRRVGRLLDGVHQIVIGRDRLMLVLPSNHPKAGSEKVTLDDVVAERFIQFSSERASTNLHKQIAEIWARAGLVPHDVQIGEGGLAILVMVARGFGNAILPSVLSGIHVPNVVWKPIGVDEQWTSSPVVLLYRIDAQNESVQSRFVDYVRRFSTESN